MGTPGISGGANDVSAANLAKPRDTAEAVAPNQVEPTDSSALLDESVGHVSDARRDLRDRSTTAGIDDAGPQVWFDLLAEAVRVLAERGRPVLAAGVSAKMRQLNPGFSPKAAGRGSFRSFLDAAAAAGVVDLSLPEVTGGVDTVIRPFAAGLKADTAPEPGFIRRDLWSAVLDWSSSARRIYNKRTGQLDEPGGPLDDADAVSVPHLDKDQHLRWMHDFVEKTDHPALGKHTLVGLDGHEAATAFARALRNETWLGRRWREVLRAHVAETLDSWADANGIPRDHLRESAKPSAAAAVEVPGVAGPTDDKGKRLLVEAEGAEIRARILQAVAAMPLSDLLRLPIPVEYLLR